MQVSAIQNLFADEVVNATVRGEGVKEVPGREWQSYLRTMPVRGASACGLGLAAAGLRT